MIEVSFDEALFPQLERPLEKQHLGGPDFEKNNPFAKIRGYIGDTPVAFSLAEVFEALGQPIPTILSLYHSQFDVWMVRNNVYVKKDGGIAEPVRVGVEIEYRNDELKLNKGRTCAVAALLPTPLFREIGRLKGHIDGEVSPAGEIKLGVDVVPLLKEMPLSANLKVGMSAGLEVGLNFSFSVKVPLISAVGIGHSRAEWEFHEESTTLYDQDIETWTFLALPRVKSKSKVDQKLEYRLRLYIVLRTAFISTRHNTPWKNLSCSLVEAQNTLA
jgi:hypothetical protein